MNIPLIRHQTEHPFRIAMFAFCLASNLLDAAPLKILPLGDSITHGFNGINYPNGSIPGGYRRDLRNRLAFAGIPHDFLGSRTDNAGTGMDPHHEGHPGFRTDQALSKLTSWLAGNPDIVLMHLGTNDLIQHIPLATAIANLSTLIQRITTNAPQRILYVATIIPIIDERDGRTAAQWATTINSYNTQVRSLVRQHAGAGRRVMLVDMYANLVYSNSEVKKRFFQPGDGTHPGQAGYDQMAALWFAAIRNGQGTPPVAGPDLIANGGFESGLGGWLSSGNVKLAQGPPYLPSEGIQLLAFNGGNQTPNGVVSQALATQVGQTYQLSFDIGVLAFNTTTQSLGVSIVGNAIISSQKYNLKTIKGKTILWKSESLSFIANSKTTTLTFSDRSSTSHSIDLLLDNIRIVSTIPSLTVTPPATSSIGRIPFSTGAKLTVQSGHNIIRIDANLPGHYFLERSPDLLVWARIDEVLLEGPAGIEFVDESASPISVSHYYRIGHSEE